MKVNWAGLMRLGLVGLRLSPEVFWALTPAELMLMAGLGGRAPMGRDVLDELAALYPDKGRDDDDRDGSG